METWARYANHRSIKSTTKPLDLITLLLPNYFPLPTRPYYHMETGSLLTLGQWLHETESEVLNGDWLRQLENGQLHEFTDVTDAEKEFIKLWNGFLDERVVLIPELMPLLVEFLEKYAIKIEQRDMYVELLAHLTSMWDNDQIGQAALHWLCRHYSELVACDEATRTAVCMLAASGMRKSSEL